MTDGAFKALLKQARNNNNRIHITGILVHVAGLFVQFLEGPEKEIDQVYAKIASDERHQDVILIAEDYAQQRYFTSWSMAFKALSEDSLNSAVGYRTFDRELAFAYPNDRQEEKLPALILLQNFIREIE